MAIHFLFGLIFPLERTVTAVPPTITTTPSAAFPALLFAAPARYGSARNIYTCTLPVADADTFYFYKVSGSSFCSSKRSAGLSLGNAKIRFSISGSFCVQ